MKLLSVVPGPEIWVAVAVVPDPDGEILRAYP